jgi:hypothetical protein
MAVFPNDRRVTWTSKFPAGQSTGGWVANITIKPPFDSTHCVSSMATFDGLTRRHLLFVISYKAAFQSGQPHEFRCVSITPFRAPHHEHGHIEAAGTNSQRARQMSFDGVDTDKDVDVSGTIRLNP